VAALFRISRSIRSTFTSRLNCDSSAFSAVVRAPAGPFPSSTSACLSQTRIKLSARSRSFDTWPTLRPPLRTSLTVSALNSGVKLRRARFCLDMGSLFYAHPTERGCPRNRVNAITYVATDEGWLYLAVILDLFSRRVVGWAASPTNDRALALMALSSAVRARRPPPGLVHHSDRGSPYASDDYREALRSSGIVASMSRRADCYDNAVAESFFATLRAELLDHEHLECRNAGIACLSSYIEDFYNTVRRHSYTGYVSPIEFELKRLTAEKAA
jgi:transposase InsO family protein